jgi:hypothetical protein
MLVVDRDKYGIPTYKVYNDYNDVIIITGNGLLARYINDHVKGVPRSKMINIGGDPGTRNKASVPIWRAKHVYRR